MTSQSLLTPGAMLVACLLGLAIGVVLCVVADRRHGVRTNYWNLALALLPGLIIILVQQVLMRSQQ